MSRPPTLNARQLVKTLDYLGFAKAHQKGSHVFFSHPDGRTTVVPISAVDFLDLF